MRRFFLLLVMCGLLAAAGFGLYVLRWPLAPKQETFVDVVPGMSSRQIGAQLERQGIITSRYAFEVLRLVKGGTLKAGEYRFVESREMGAVYEQIERGEVYTLTLTIPEGANVFDVAHR